MSDLFLFRNYMYTMFFMAGTSKASVIFATKDGRLKKIYAHNLDHVLTKVLYNQYVLYVYKCWKVTVASGGDWYPVQSSRYATYIQ